ncbi:MAG: hypothetical protein DHS20C17_01700 [Cyclobacteriaceae bacterium]|nr:MAG: hypothetical protein DHS20C17_01700 [Cyclobacteriaceae bacterium]
MSPVIITPVKNSLDTVKQTIRSVNQSDLAKDYYIFNDFSDKPTEEYLAAHANELAYNLVNLSEYVTTPSPNYRTVLIMAQKMALEKERDLIVVESDVIIESSTISAMISFKDENPKAGMVAAITTDSNGKINFPYNHISESEPDVINTKRSLSFCCTLLSNQLLKALDFKTLRTDKDWYDVHISRQSRSLGFDNYLLKNVQVQHLPHSSRPWKNEKYNNPLRYYFKKYFLKRDRI